MTTKTLVSLFRSTADRRKAAMLRPMPRVAQDAFAGTVS
jgi:hypothetical protein